MNGCADCAAGVVCRWLNKNILEKAGLKNLSIRSAALGEPTRKTKISVMGSCSKMFKGVE
jgi:hypothetical protein